MDAKPKLNVYKLYITHKRFGHHKKIIYTELFRSKPYVCVTTKIVEKRDCLMIYEWPH